MVVSIGPGAPKLRAFGIGSGGRTRTSDQAVTYNPEISLGHGLSLRHGPVQALGAGRISL